MVQKANTVFRDFVTDGIPSSGKHDPDKVEIRKWGTYVENGLLGATAGATIYDSKGDMEADTSQAANAMAWVLGDPIAANNGIYQFDGTATWTRLGDLPYSFIYATNTGAGTANAIKATTSVPIPSTNGAAQIVLPITATNTASPVTVSFNGDDPLTIVTGSGVNVAVGGLVKDRPVVGMVVGSELQLLSDIATSADKAAAEAAQAAAEEARDDAEAAAAGVNLPSITVADAKKTLQVKDDGSGYRVGLGLPAPVSTDAGKLAEVSSDGSSLVVGSLGIDALLAMIDSTILLAAESVYMNGEELPAPGDHDGESIGIQDGDHYYVAVSDGTSWVLPNNVTPTWLTNLPADPVAVLHFGRNRLWNRIWGYKRLDGISVERTGDAWAADNDGVLHKFETDEAAITDRGLLVQRASRNFGRFSRDGRITHQINRGTMTGDAFVDGEHVTATGGGDGYVVLDQSEATALAIRDGTGTFSGTLSGENSNSCPIDNVLEIWARASCDVTRDATGADGTANAGTVMTATGANATLIQSTTASSSGDWCYSGRVKRVSGTGVIKMTVDNGATWKAIDPTDTYQHFFVAADNPGGTIGFGFEVVEDADAIAFDFAMLENALGPTSPIVTKRDNSIVRGSDKINSAVSVIGNQLTTNNHTVVILAIPEISGNNVGTFLETNDGSADNRLTVNYGWKESWPGADPDHPDINMGVTIAADTDETAPHGYDPQTENVRLGTLNATGYTLNRATGYLVAALNGDTQVALDGVNPIDTDFIPNQSNNTDLNIGCRGTGVPLNGYIQAIVVLDASVTETAYGELTDLDGAFVQGAKST